MYHLQASFQGVLLLAHDVIVQLGDTPPPLVVRLAHHFHVALILLQLRNLHARDQRADFRVMVRIMFRVRVTF